MDAGKQRTYPAAGGVIALTHPYSACRALEDENRKLKKLLAESMLDRAALKDLRPAAERDAVARLWSMLGG